MEDTSVCAICLGDMGPGQATLTAECSHTFHLCCISESVAYGNHDCPLCKARWSVLPAVNPFHVPDPVPQPQPPPSPMPTPSPLVRRYVPPFHRRFGEQVTAEARVYYDDEQVENVQAQAAATNGAVVLKTHCEYPALARDACRDNFAVLVHAKAPGAGAVADEAPRAPLDLVTVLDVSASMSGSKLGLLKQAMGFVIDNLGPADRLSVVSFSDNASRVVRLMRMSDDGKASAKRAVRSLVADDCTNIGEGLRVAAQVLGDRRYKNTVASIILLSDGQDTYISPRHGNSANYIDLVPRSFRHTGAGNRPTPIHTFGFGRDHDAAAMHTIAEATGGTFSFIENQAVIQDSFAQCIGGLLSVAVQEARIAVTCLHPGVRLREVKSGRYENRVDVDFRAASVDVGELYADEDRRFLLFVDVPRAEATDDVTHLLKVSCTYRDTMTGQVADVAGDDAVVQRPVEVTGMEPSMEVERERVRSEATEDMAAARAAAERGAHAEAVQILEGRLVAVERSRTGLAGDLECEQLEDDLLDFSACVEDEQQYVRRGRAHLLAGMSSYAQQRPSYGAAMPPPGAPPVSYGAMPYGATRIGCPRRSVSYLTPAMQNMLNKSRRSRDQQQQTSQPPKRMRDK